jgi:tetratricopeptide (TPR) repeat protein
MKSRLKIRTLAICFIILLLNACRSSDKKSANKVEILQSPPFGSITDSIHQFPNEANLYFERAQLLSRNNLHELALEDYKKSWDIKPEEQTAIQYASNLSITNRLREELVFLQSCLGQFPENREIKRILGEVYVQSGNSREALSLYDNLLKNNPSDFEAWYEKGMLYAQLKDTAKAIDALNNAFSIQPTGTYALELAHLYAESRDTRALALCDQVIRSDSAQELVDPFFIKGIYYANTRQYELATIQFDSCIRRDWKFTQAYIEKGIAFFKQDNYDVAMNTFRMAATVSNTDPDAYFWIGRCYEVIHNKAEAIQYYQRAISLDKNFTEAKEAIKRLGS